MDWYEEMQAWLASPDPEEFLDRLLDNVLDAGLRGRITWAQAERTMYAARTGRLADVVVMLFGARFSEEQLETVPRALSRGAGCWELLLLGVHGRNCEGEDLPVVDTEELRRRMAAAVTLGQERRSAWLTTYTALLVAEWEWRRSDAESWPQST
jgi:hypothetical protein